MYVLKTRNWSVLNSRRNEYAPTRAFLRHYTERLQTKNRKRKNLTRTKEFVLGFYLWTEVDWQSQSVVVQKPYCLFGLFRFSLLARTTANTACFLPPTPPKRRHLTGVFFLVDRGGFEPPKSETSDLQSDPFGRSGICPYGASRWNRTADRGIFSPLLYQLSYRGMSVDREEPEKRVKKWRPKRGSNSWPPAWQAGALTKLSYWAVQQDMKNFGGPSRIRTADQSVMSRQLWPLS